MYGLHARSAPYYFETPFFKLGDGRLQPAKDFWKQATHEEHGCDPHSIEATNEFHAKNSSLYSRLPQEIRDKIMRYVYNADVVKRTLLHATTETVDNDNDLVVRKYRDPLLIQRRGEDFLVDNGIVIQLPSWVGIILVSKQFFAEALPFFEERRIIHFQGCTLQEVLPGLQKSQCLEWVVLKMLRYVHEVYLRVDNFSVSVDLLPHGEYFQHLHKITINPTRRAIWVKAHPNGRIVNRECLGFIYEMLDVNLNPDHATSPIACVKCIDEYCSTDQTCTQAAKLSRHFKACRRECSMVVHFGVEYLREGSTRYMVSGASHGSVQGRGLTE